MAEHLHAVRVFYKNFICICANFILLYSEYNYLPVCKCLSILGIYAVFAVVLPLTTGLFRFAILMFAALAHARDGKVQEKRGVAGYIASTAAPAYASAFSNPVTYTKAVQPALEQKTVSAAQQYVSQPAAYSAPAQQYYQAEPQAVAYAQPAVSKYASVPAVQKFAYTAQQQPQQYSSAADVSSFSYSSPVVAYNNLGFLHQIAGKANTAPQRAPVTYAAAPAPKVQYTSSPSVYSTSQNNYDAPSAYQAVAQKAVYSEAPQAQPEAQAITYQTSPVSQRIAYQAVPAYQTAQAVQKVAPQVTYATSPSQQFIYQQQAPQTQSASSQGYEAAAHSAPQLFYSQPAAPQQQYYSVVPQAKYARPGVTYAN